MKTLNTRRVVANFNPDDVSSEDSGFIGDLTPAISPEVPPNG